MKNFQIKFPFIEISGHYLVGKNGLFPVVEVPPFYRCWSEADSSAAWFRQWLLVWRPLVQVLC
jgi:hypothetical protein